MKLVTTTEKPYPVPRLLPLKEKEMPTMRYLVRVNNLNNKKKEYRWYQTDDHFQLVKKFTKDWDHAEVFEDLYKGKGKPYYQRVWTKK